MQRIVLSAAAALAACTAGFLTVDRANAITAAPDGLRPAIESINPVENVACWRRGAYGWGWYPCRRYYAPRYYAPRLYYAPRPYYRPYGYRRWY